MVGVSIVAYNTADSELIECIRSLSANYVDSITVVDNSRRQATRDLCRRLADSGNVALEYVGNENRGYGAGHNVAIRRSIDRDYRYHIVLNSDVRFEPESIGRLVEVMEEDPSIGALQPRIVNPDGSDQFTVRMLPTPFDLIVRRFFPKRMFGKRRSQYELRHLDHSREFDVAYHQGSFMMLRCKALRDVGLFDERFFMYPEDIDLTRRINERYRTVYSPVATVVHAHRGASYFNGRMLRIHIVNMIRYFNKWGWFFDSGRRKINRGLRERR